MTVRRCAILGALDVPSACTLKVQRSGYAVRTVTLTPGEYYPLELLAHLQAAVRAAGAELSNFTASLVGDRATLSSSDTTSITEWTYATLATWLRMAAAPLSVTPSVAGTRAMVGVFCPNSPAVQDEPQPQTVRSDVLGFDGVDCHYYGARRHRMVSVRADGWERSGEADEMQSLIALWQDYVATGATVRWHWDITNTTVKSDANPKGYVAGKIINPKTFAPGRIRPTYYGAWRFDFELVEG